MQSKVYLVWKYHEREWADTRIVAIYFNEIEANKHAASPCAKYYNYDVDECEVQQTFDLATKND